MSDWIHQLRAKDDAELQKRHDEAERQRETEGLIKALAPKYWAELVQQADADCALLKDTFANAPARQCFFNRTHDGGIKLQGQTSSRTILFLRLDPSSLAIQQDVHSGEDRAARRELLRFELDKSNRVSLTGVSGSISDPKKAAEEIIKRAMR